MPTFIILNPKSIFCIPRIYLMLFLKESCTYLHTGSVNMCAHVLPRMRVCAWIFTKLFLVVFYYLMSLSFKFREDPIFGCGDICETIMTFVWRFCAHSWQNVCAQVYASCARVCAWIFTKLFSFGLYYLMNLSFKFYKDPSFSYGDICKTMLAFVWSLIFYVLFF